MGPRGDVGPDLGVCGLLIAVVLLALLAGTWGVVTVGPATVGLNPVDGVALALAVAGAVVAWRRRELRVDLAVLGYVALVLVALVQVLVLPEPWQVATGAGRLTVPALLLLGLSQLRPDRGWTTGFAVGGSALVGLVVVGLVRGAGDPAVASFYDLKHHVVTPLGASNLVAAVLVVAFLVLLGAAFRAEEVRRSQVLSALALLAAVGLAATLSRGAAVAVGVTVLVGAVVVRSTRMVVVTAACAVVAAGSVVLLTSPLDDGPTTVVTAAAASDQAEAAPPVVTGPTRLDAVARSAAGARLGDRGHLARTAGRAVGDRPLTGVGLNRFDTAAGHGLAHDHAHNLGLHVAATTGIPGLLAYLAVWALLVWRLVRLPSGPVRTAVALAAAGLFLHSQIEALVLTRTHEVLLALLLAVSGAQAGARGVVRLGRARLSPPRPVAGRRPRSS